MKKFYYENVLNNENFVAKVKRSYQAKNTDKTKE